MLPIPVQTSYMELLQRFEAPPPLSISGSIALIEKSGRRYYVSRTRLGDRVVEQSIGPQNEQNDQAVVSAREEQKAFKAWSDGNAAIVNMLKSTGALKPDAQSAKVLSALSKIGFFDAGGLLGGTHAFRLYPLFLGVEAPREQMSMTGDIDMIAPSQIKLCAPNDSVMKRLSKLGLKFNTRFGMLDNAVPKYVFENNIELEFLGSAARGNETTRFHPGIGEHVQSLRFLEFSMENPVRQAVLYRHGVEVLTPSPERFALHKLIVAQLRSGTYALKREKDIAQAAWLLEHLVVRRPEETWAAYEEIQNRGKGWIRRLNASLKISPSARASLENLKAEMNDVDTDFDDDYEM